MFSIFCIFWMFWFAFVFCFLFAFLFSIFLWFFVLFWTFASIVFPVVFCFSSMVIMDFRLFLFFFSFPWFFCSWVVWLCCVPHQFFLSCFFWFSRFSLVFWNFGLFRSVWPFRPNWFFGSFWQCWRQIYGPELTSFFGRAQLAHIGRTISPALLEEFSFHNYFMAENQNC